MSRLKELRVSNKLKVIDVAKKTDLNPSFITKIENGNRGFSVSTAKKLAVVYNTTIEDIVNNNTIDTNNIASLRANIDLIDRELALLFSKRMEIVKSVIAYKNKNKMPILDTSREDIIIEKNTSLIENKEYKDYFLMLYSKLLEISKEYQKNNTNSNQ